jgi:hypothetical protein
MVIKLDNKYIRYMINNNMTTNIKIGDIVKIDSNPIYGRIYGIHDNTVYIKDRWEGDSLGRDYNKKLITPSKFKIGDNVKVSETIYGCIHNIHKNTIFIKNRWGGDILGRDYPKEWITHII